MYVYTHEVRRGGVGGSGMGGRGGGRGGTSLPEVIECIHILNRCVVISKEGYRLDGSTYEE